MTPPQWLSLNIPPATFNMNIDALKSLAVGHLLTTSHGEELARARRAGAQFRQNVKAHERREKNRRRCEEARAFREQAARDTAENLGIPSNRLGLFLLYNFTPIRLKNGRLIWLEMRKLYNIDTLSRS